MSQQSLIDAAKAADIAYNNKDWDAVKAAVAPRFVYDEVATHLRVEGIDQVLVESLGELLQFRHSESGDRSKG